MKSQVFLILVMVLSLTASLNFKLNHDGNADLVVGKYDANKDKALDKDEFIKFMESTA